MKELCVLDTCAWLWIAKGDVRITSSVKKILNDADWLVSAISVWEVAMLAAKKRIELTCSIEQWVDEALIRVPGITLAPLSPDIAIASCHLQKCSLSDPADRIIIATAMHHQASLVTADKKIIAYCHTHHLNVIQI